LREAEGLIKKTCLLSKTLVIGILILLIIMSVVSSTGNIIEYSPFNTQVLDLVDSSDELLFHGKIAYAWKAYPEPFGPCYFYLDDPGNITMLKTYESPYFPSGGTWTTSAKWLLCEFDTGVLLEIDTETGDIEYIGGGGTSCNGLAWDPVNTRLYGTDGSNLIEYDPETGEQEVIGSHGITTTMIDLAVNTQGVCYAWDILFSGTTTLFTVDLETGEATEIGDMGILYPGYYGSFDWEGDTSLLYLAGESLVTFDVETLELTEIGDFEGGAGLSSLAIPWYWGFPKPEFKWTPIHPDPGEIILFNASNSYDPDGFITMYRWDWDNDGVIDENHTIPTSTHTFEEVGYYPVALWVVDNDNRTDRKLKTVRVGNYPPDTPEIEGKRKYKVGEGGLHPYTIYSKDPDGDDISYIIDWGCGSIIEIGPYSSGENITINVSIPLRKGTYIVFKIRAIDIYGADSNWAILEVSVPRTRVSYQWLNDLIERFPFLERLLTILKGDIVDYL
jgi:PKD repeat protein